MGEGDRTRERNAEVARRFFSDDYAVAREGLGKDGWLPKPFKAAQLEAFIARLVDRSITHA